MELSLARLRKSPVTQIVSLGMRCATAYNLRRHFHFRTAFPFDWWVTPLEGLNALLSISLNIDAIYASQNLELTEKAKSVRHKASDVRLHHEFPRQVAVIGAPVRQNFLQHVEKPRLRTQHLVDRFLALNDARERILFVREQNLSSLVQADVISASTQLSRLFPNPEWTLAWIQGPEEEAKFGWKGDPLSWDGVLSGLDITIDESRHLPFIDDPAPIANEDVYE